MEGDAITSPYCCQVKRRCRRIVERSIRSNQTNIICTRKEKKETATVFGNAALLWGSMSLEGTPFRDCAESAYLTTLSRPASKFFVPFAVFDQRMLLTSENGFIKTSCDGKGGDR
ncbi:hypothetical protein CEXT_116451 [Caerostris extrusa]|uniref:Uncharacterized protein n=1 Tax=Caerostris extrusa TaxID=172846 RepID=A0AAV4VEX1_CAEEX|nr:hypothetical protein CEXT_116451 [Caerostris extrusa]